MASTSGGEITKAYAEAFDAYREAFQISGCLKLFEKNTGSGPNTLLATLYTGWKPDQERIRGQVETLYKVLVVDQDVLTPDVMKRVDRLEWDDFYCTVQSAPPPYREPRIWVFFTKEIVLGAIR